MYTLVIQLIMVGEFVRQKHKLLMYCTISAVSPRV